MMPVVTAAAVPAVVVEKGVWAHLAMLPGR